MLYLGHTGLVGGYFGIHTHFGCPRCSGNTLLHLLYKLLFNISSCSCGLLTTTTPCHTVYAPSAGILFILATKQVLGSHEAESEEVGPDSLSMVGWEKMVLIMFVMTLHSLTEGVGKPNVDTCLTCTLAFSCCFLLFAAAIVACRTVSICCVSARSSGLIMQC